MAWTLPSQAQTARQILDTAVAEFAAARIESSVARFDDLVVRYPDDMPYLWQRGIALYYAERWDDCVAQFEAHRLVNPDDVENAAWHYLCVARRDGVASAEAELLPVGTDFRVPMREVYELYRGALSPEQVLAATNDSLSRFYGHLYVGLWYEAQGDEDEASAHLTEAAGDEYARPGLYMHMVARVHRALPAR